MKKWKIKEIILDQIKKILWVNTLGLLLHL